MIERILDARRAGVPIVAAATTDQVELAAAVMAAVNAGTGHIRWDCVSGIVAMNEPGQVSLKWIGKNTEELAMESPNPATAMDMLRRIGENTIVHCINAHRVVSDLPVTQGMCNLRDQFKANGRTLILYGSQFDLPSEFRNDVVLIDIPTPDDAWLEKMAEELTGSMLGSPLDQKLIQSTIPALRGLGGFVAEQCLAMALGKDGTVNMESLWALKKTAIGQIKGLSLSLGGLDFESLGGLDSIKNFMRARAVGRQPFQAIVFTDEMEKAFGGFEGDNTGVIKRMVGTFLSWMEDKGQDGVLLVGPGGSGKSALAKAIGPQFGLPTITMNFSEMLGSLVGSSEWAIKECLKAIDGVARGNAFVAATCNRLESLPPELKRRFKSGIWMFALPTEEERKNIWEIQRKAYSINDGEPTPIDTDWTGAEIRNCCEIAYKTGFRLDEVGKRYIIPIAQQDPASIGKLYAQAEGKFLSAAYDGSFRAPTIKATGLARQFGN